MKTFVTFISIAAVSGALLAPLQAQAQNIAIVNGKAVPKARVDALLKQVSAQAAAQGQQLPPDLGQRARDKVVLDEIFLQEAEKRGLAASGEYKQQMEAARQALLIQALNAAISRPKLAVSSAKATSTATKPITLPSMRTLNTAIATA